MKYCYLLLLLPCLLTSAPKLLLTTPNGGERLIAGSVTGINWDGADIGAVLLEFSGDDGASWSAIGTAAGVDENFVWTVPDTLTSRARVRLSADGLTDISAGAFTISDGPDPLNIIVLGSSTAEGNGADPVDSSWVNRYRNHLTYDRRFAVINLGKGGYATTQVMPEGYVPPDGITERPDPARNVDRALAYAPAAIIVNMPSNDVAKNYSLHRQMAHYDTLVRHAAAAGVPVWIATTQPRNFKDLSKRTLQAEIKDSIVAVYGERALDFWSPVVQADSINPVYDKGDGVHVKNNGHYLLFREVAGAGIAAAVAEITLPVVLRDFTVRRAAGAVVVEWGVDEQDGVQAYAVENRGRRGGWTELGRVNALDGRRAYRWSGLPAGTGSGYYRLRIIDGDGSAGYGPLARLEEAPVARAFPNPTTGTVTVPLSNGVCETPVTLFNGAGECLGRWEAEGAAMEIDLSGFARGIYVIWAGETLLRVSKR